MSCAFVSRPEHTNEKHLDATLAGCILYLKRWGILPGGLSSRKVHDHIRSDLTMDLPGPTSYELYGVLVHDGSVRLGHYTAYISSAAGAWLLYDDHKTAKPVAIKDVLARARNAESCESAESLRRGVAPTPALPSALFLGEALRSYDEACSQTAKALPASNLGSWVAERARANKHQSISRGGMVESLRGRVRRASYWY